MLPDTLDITTMAVSNPLIGTYLKQISHVCDQVADFVNFYGFTETASALSSLNVKTVELSCNKTQDLTETFNEYGYVTLGITWIPGKYYVLLSLKNPPISLQETSLITKKHDYRE